MDIHHNSATPKFPTLMNPSTLIDQSVCCQKMSQSMWYSLSKDQSGGKHNGQQNLKPSSTDLYQTALTDTDRVFKANLPSPPQIHWISEIRPSTTLSLYQGLTRTICDLHKDTRGVRSKPSLEKVDVLLIWQSGGIDA